MQLIKGLEAARGNGTSMISLIMPPKDQVGLSLRCKGRRTLRTSLEMHASGHAAVHALQPVAATMLAPVHPHNRACQATLNNRESRQFCRPSYTLVSRLESDEQQAICLSAGMRRSAMLSISPHVWYSQKHNHHLRCNFYVGWVHKNRNCKRLRSTAGVPSAEDAGR